MQPSSVHHYHTEHTIQGGALSQPLVHVLPFVAIIDVTFQ